MHGYDFIWPRSLCVLLLFHIWTCQCSMYCIHCIEVNQGFEKEERFKFAHSDLHPLKPHGTPHCLRTTSSSNQTKTFLFVAFVTIKINMHIYKDAIIICKNSHIQTTRTKLREANQQESKEICTYAPRFPVIDT